MEIEELLMELLRKRNKDFLTIRSVRDSLPADAASFLGLKKGQTSLRVVREKLTPFLDNHLKEFEGARTIYLGFNRSIEDIILTRLKKKPDISSKQLRNQLPFKNNQYITAINHLISTGRISCILHEKTHSPRSFSIIDTDVAASIYSIENDLVQFEKAIKKVGSGRQFVPIHAIRNYLNWPKERFEAAIEKLNSDLTIQLQGGDPSLLTQEELRQSYIDSKGRVRITLNWIK